jgi:hypothetical protein
MVFFCGLPKYFEFTFMLAGLSPNLKDHSVLTKVPFF